MTKKTINPKVANGKSSDAATDNSGSESRATRKVRKRLTRNSPTTSTLPAASGSLKPGFPIVGIGASAGGLEPLEELFGSLSADTGLAFVVVTHQHLRHTTFHPMPPDLSESPGKSRKRRKKTPDAERTVQLERDLHHIKEAHRARVEESQTLNEVLESLNEELTMINGQLQSKLNEFVEVNNDLQNLLNSTDIATMFLDVDLNIRRYTEEATGLIMLRPTGVGRPIFELASNLEYRNLAADGREVLRTLVCKEGILYTTGGVGYLVRVVPYRTTANVVDGLVLTFVDIGRLTWATRETETSGDPFKQIVETMRHPLLMLDQQLRVIFVNDIFCGTFQTKRYETEGRVVYELGNGTSPKCGSY